MRNLFGSGGIYQLQDMVGVCVVPWRSLCDAQDVTPVGEIWDMERMEGSSGFLGCLAYDFWLECFKVQDLAPEYKHMEGSVIEIPSVQRLLAYLFIFRQMCVTEFRFVKPGQSSYLGNTLLVLC